jgi:hypothetical protein
LKRSCLRCVRQFEVDHESRQSTVGLRKTVGCAEEHRQDTRPHLTDPALPFCSRGTHCSSVLLLSAKPEESLVRGSREINRAPHHDWNDQRHPYNHEDCEVHDDSR